MEAPAAVPAAPPSPWCQSSAPPVSKISAAAMSSHASACRSSWRLTCYGYAIVRTWCLSSYKYTIWGVLKSWGTQKMDGILLEMVNKGWFRKGHPYFQKQLVRHVATGKRCSKPRGLPIPSFCLSDIIPNWRAANVICLGCASQAPCYLVSQVGSLRSGYYWSLDSWHHEEPIADYFGRVELWGSLVSDCLISDARGLQYSDVRQRNLKQFVTRALVLHQVCDWVEIKVATNWLLFNPSQGFG